MEPILIVLIALFLLLTALGARKRLNDPSLSHEPIGLRHYVIAIAFGAVFFIAMDDPNSSHGADGDAGDSGGFGGDSGGGGGGGGE